MFTRVISLSLLIVISVSCTTDRDISSLVIDNPDSELIHYWDFNNVSTTTALLTPSQTTGGTSIQYLGVDFDRVLEGSELNARLGSEAASALRLRNPSGDFIISMPTTGYKDVVFTYASMRTNNGAQKQILAYSLDGINYQTTGLLNNEVGVSTVFVIQQFSFVNVPGANNNPNFKIKISFDVNADGLTGNNRFDNISLDGIPTGTGPGPDPIDPNLYLVHYWNFNNVPAGNLNDAIPADESLINVSQTAITYPGTGAGYADRVSPGSELNLRSGAEVGTGLRLRNPSDTREMIIEAPTQGYKNIVMKFATAKSSAAGAGIQNYFYTLDGSNYTQQNLPVSSFEPNIEPIYDIVTLDFSQIPGVNNNPNFKVKVTFSGASASGTSGNNRFDNITLEGNIN
jgi:hypothetical protein